MSACLSRHGMRVGRVLVPRTSSKDCRRRLLPAPASYHNSLICNGPHQFPSQQPRTRACHHPETFLRNHCDFKQSWTQATHLKSNNETFLHLLEIQNPQLPVARMFSTAHTTVDPHELKKFQTWALRWWDEEGVYSALHSMNDLRVPFIRDTLISKSNNHDVSCPLLGLKILDVGCGGGVLSEPLSRLGASVTGIDPLENNIRTAELHKSFDPELERGIQYKACSLEDMEDEAEEMFDAVVASEVVEHVSDLESFIQCCHSVLQPGGSLFITTISKTTASYALGIVVAEKIVGIVPDGTHDWEKFVTPEELERLLESNGFIVETVKGMLYNPLSTSWRWIDNTSLNYALHAVKAGLQEQTISSEQVPEDHQMPT